MAFTLDTSGVVYGQSPQWGGTCVLWSDLSPFVQGYVEALFASLRSHLLEQAALASAHGDRTPVGDVRGYAEDKVWSKRFEAQADALGFSDLSPEALALILRDCGARRKDQPGLGDKAQDGERFYTDRQAGHACTASGVAIPPLTRTLGDDGRIYLREA